MLPDRYTLYAQIAPVLLVALPVGLAAFLYVPLSFWPNIAFTTLIVALPAVFFGDWARNQGKDIETDLWDSWGGAPSIKMLRYDGPLDDEEVSRIHKKALKLWPELAPLPSLKEERTNPNESAESYRALNERLLGKFRHRGLVREESISYGRRRNSYAIRRLGRSIACIGLGLVLLHAVREGIKPEHYVVLTASGAVCLIWFFDITEARVEQAANDFAKQLRIAFVSHTADSEKSECD